MNYSEFLRQMDSPVPGARLKKWPHGDITQLWGENPKLYSAAANRHDDFHTHFGGHMGIDIAGSFRTPIRASHDGVIHRLDTDRAAPGGLQVWLESDVFDDDGTPSKAFTVYCHLDEISANPGQRITKGQTIGYMGNTGFIVTGGTLYWGNAPANQGIHLHCGLYEYILKNGQWQPRYINVLKNTSDPLPYISETPENPHGNLSGFVVMLGHMKAYLSRSA